MTLHFFGLPVAQAAGYSIADVGHALSFEGGPVGVDIETTGLRHKRWGMTAMTVGTADEAAVLDPANAMHRAVYRRVLSRASAITLHNAAFDIPVLYAMGLLGLDEVERVTDTIVYARLAQPDERKRQAQLGDACSTYLHHPAWADAKKVLERMATSANVSRSTFFERASISDLGFAAYAGFDVVMTMRLAPAVRAAAAAALDHDYGPDDVERMLEREQVINRQMLALACRGLALDYEALDEITAEMRTVVAGHAKTLADLGIDPDLDATSLKRTVLLHLDGRGELGPWPRTPKTDQLVTTRAAMDQLQHPLGAVVVDMNRAQRFLDVYADKAGLLAVDGVVHPQINVLAATTGRMSIGDPPLQQFPESVRRMFAAPAPITSLDWSQIEPALAMNLAGADMSPYEDEGADLYSLVPDVERKVAKVVLLAQLYGQGLTALGTRLGLDEDGARAVRDAVLGALPEVARLLTKVRDAARQRGSIVTLSGREIPVPRDPRTANFEVLAYIGVNYVIQGGAYDLLAEALYQIHLAGLDDALFMVVHDEVVVATEAADDVDRIMRRAPEALCRLTGRQPVLRTGRVDLGRNWSAKKE